MEINCLSQFFTNCWYSVHACTRKWGRFASYTLCTMPRTVNMKITEKLGKTCDASSNIRFPLHFQFHVSYFFQNQILKWTSNRHIFCTRPWSSPLFFSARFAYHEDSVNPHGYSNLGWVHCLPWRWNRSPPRRHFKCSDTQVYQYCNDSWQHTSTICSKPSQHPLTFTTGQALGKLLMEMKNY